MNFDGLLNVLSAVSVDWIEGDWNDACVATVVWLSMIVSYAKYRQCCTSFLRHMEHGVYVKYGRESSRVGIQMVFGNEYLLWLYIGYLKNGS